MMHAVVAERGQVTIPKPIRDRLGLTPHTVVEVREENGRVILTKVIHEDVVARVRGCVQLENGTDAVIRELRGES